MISVVSKKEPDIDKDESWKELCVANGGRCPEASDKVKKLVRQGIPTKYRGCAWLFYSGGLEKMHKFPSRYTDLPPGELLSAVLLPQDKGHQNQRDLVSRLAAFHPKYNSEDLVHITETLLKFLTDEQSFWLVSTVLDDMFYGWMVHLNPHQDSHRRRKSVLTEWILPEAIWIAVQEKIPELAEWLMPAKKEMIGIISEWISCWFTSVFGNETLYHIWDCMFYEGSKIWFRVVIGILRQHEAFFLKMSSPWRCVAYLKKLSNYSSLESVNDDWVKWLFQRFNGACGSLSRKYVERIKEDLEQEKRQMIAAQKFLVAYKEPEFEPPKLEKIINEYDRDYSPTRTDKPLPRRPSATMEKIRSLARKVKSDELLSLSTDQKRRRRRPSHSSVEPVPHDVDNEFDVISSYASITASQRNGTKESLRN